MKLSLNGSSFHNPVSEICFNYLAVILFQSQEHVNCPPQPGCVRAHIESMYKLPAK